MCKPRCPGIWLPDHGHPVHQRKVHSKCDHDLLKRILQHGGKPPAGRARRPGGLDRLPSQPWGQRDPARPDRPAPAFTRAPYPAPDGVQILEFRRAGEALVQPSKPFGLHQRQSESGCSFRFRFPAWSDQGCASANSFGQRIKLVRRHTPAASKCHLAMPFRHLAPASGACWRCARRYSGMLLA